MPFVARVGEHFHPNRIADRGLASEQLFDSVADRRPGVAEKFD